MELSRLSSPSGRIVADTSAIINLNGTRCAEDILRALPERLIVVDIAASELEDGRRKGRQDADLLGELSRAGLLQIESLSDVGEALFEQLVVGRADATLDDGEAATIAYAVEHSIGLVVDDRKARRLCRERHGGIPMYSSVEIFRHPLIHKALGQDRLSVAVLNALKNARMRVLPEHLEWVVSLIGEANADSCRSLPRHQQRTGS